MAEGATSKEPLRVGCPATDFNEEAKGIAVEAASDPTQNAEAQSDEPTSNGNNDAAAIESTPQRTSSKNAMAASLCTPSTPMTPASPAPRRPKPPAKGILKPPPPPARPTLSGRLRDIAGVAKSLFDPLDEQEQHQVNGTGHAAPSASSAGESSATGAGAAVGSAFSAFSGRLGAGFNRLVVAASQASPTISSPQGSPMGLRSISLPDGVAGALQPGQGQSEKARQKQPLKRATFVLPSLSITYPISSQGEPWSQKVIEERNRIESSFRTLLSSSVGAEYWTNDKLVLLYENACRGREERPRIAVIRALELLPPPPRARHIHIALRPPERPSPPSQPSPQSLEHPLTRHAAEALADILNIEWGLSDLRLENGAVDTDDALKPILHALLVSGTLPSLSLAGNKRLKAGGWRLLAVFMKKARFLRFLDLSDTAWDRKGIDYLVQALTCAPVTPPSAVSNGHAVLGPASPEKTDTSSDGTGTEQEMAEEQESRASATFVRPAPLLKETEGVELPSAVQTLRMDGCMLRANVLEALALGVRSSDVKNISLRRNRIGPLGGVALALMIRDYPDSTMSMSSLSPALTSVQSNSLVSPSPSMLSLDSATQQQQQQQQPYTPYKPRSRRTAPPPIIADDQNLPPIPRVTSSAAGGITSRTLPEGYKDSIAPKAQSLLGLDGGVNVTPVEGKMSASEFGGASMALQRSVRALDGVERIGRLLTLDLKGNEIKTGVAYIAQVLKRNRTLKVLNLSDNKIEPPGLIALAEALKYNSVLETLDISSNPCSGPNMEGVAALRTAFTLNTSLKRLFLADTGLTTDGAISLAEFLPETKSLLHLDLTGNPLIETAGILALSVGLKSNTLIRCLDLSIPPNSPNLAELSQSILQSCIRNTELAADTAKPGPSQEAVWQPIKKSALVKDVKAADRARQDREREDIAKSSEGQAREFVYTLKPDRLAPKAEETVRDLERWFAAGKACAAPGFSGVWEPDQLPKADYDILYERAKILRERIVDRIQEDPEGDELERLLGVNDTLSSMLEAGVKFTPPPRLLLPSQIVQTQLPPAATTPSNERRQPPAGIPRAVRRHMRIPSLEISSPNFSIGDSDNDSDAEEVDVVSFEQSSPGRPTTIGLLPPQPQVIDGDLLSVSDATSTSSVHSPTERASRAWVEEEGEIFRKGTRLGVAEEDEMEEHGDVSGEQLKQEILETHVERSPTRRVRDDDDKDVDLSSSLTAETSPNRAEGEDDETPQTK